MGWHPSEFVTQSCPAATPRFPRGGGRGATVPPRGATVPPRGCHGPHRVPGESAESFAKVCDSAQVAPGNSRCWQHREFIPRRRGTLNPPGALRAPPARPVGSRGVPRGPPGAHWDPQVATPYKTPTNLGEPGRTWANLGEPGRTWVAPWGKPGRRAIC